MNFTEALDILRNGNGIDPNEKEAVEFIISEICRGEGGDLRLTLATLGGELINSRNPSFSHQTIGR